MYGHSAENREGDGQSDVGCWAGACLHGTYPLGHTRPESTNQIPAPAKLPPKDFHHRAVAFLNSRIKLY
jgi:hypothetical protein